MQSPNPWGYGYAPNTRFLNGVSEVRFLPGSPMLKEIHIENYVSSGQNRQMLALPSLVFVQSCSNNMAGAPNSGSMSPGNVLLLHQSPVRTLHRSGLSLGDAECTGERHSGGPKVPGQALGGVFSVIVV